MKFFALFFCFYLTSLTVLPTVRFVKQQYAKNCHKKTTDNSEKSPSHTSCHKEKCIVKLTFNSFNFLVGNESYAFKPDPILLEELEKSQYHKNFISYYSAIIWQPPE